MDNGAAGTSDFGLQTISVLGNNVFQAEVGGDNQDALSMPSDVDGLEYLITDAPAMAGGQTKLDNLLVPADPALVRTTLEQTYHDPVLLLHDALLESAAGDITFRNFVDAMDNGAAGTSDFGLQTISVLGNNVFQAEVGGDNQDALSMPSDVDGLEYLITDAPAMAGGQTKLDNLLVPADPALVRTTLEQTYHDPVLLLHDALLESAAGDITFRNFVDAMDNGAAGTSDFGLQTISVLGNNVFLAEVGGDNQDALSMPSDVDGLEYLITDAPAMAGGQTKLDNLLVPADPALVRTTLEQTYHDPVLLLHDALLESAAGDITFRNFVDAMDNGAAGTSDFGLQTISVLGNNVFLAEVGGDKQDALSMPSDVDGLEYLITDAPAMAGGQTKLDNLLVPADPALVRTTLEQTYHDPVLLLHDALLESAAGDITFRNFVDAMDNGAAGTSDFGLQTISVLGNNVFLAEVGGDKQDALSMPSDVDGLEYLITDAPAMAGGQTKLDNLLVPADPALVRTTLEQTYHDPVLLLHDALLESAAGDITFRNFVDAMDNGAAGTSDFGLQAISVLGNNVFQAEVGGDNQDALSMPSDVDGLEYLITDAPAMAGGQTKLDNLLVPADPALVRTTLEQTYHDPVLLLQDALLESAAGDITFRNFVDAMDNGAAGTSDFGLQTISVLGNNVFQAEVGGDNQDALSMPSDVDGLEYLITDAPAMAGGQTKLDNLLVPADPALVRTTLEQTYHDPVLLLHDALLESAAGDITFRNFVDAMDNGAAGTSDFGLTITAQRTRTGIRPFEIFLAEVGGDNQDNPPNVGFMNSDANGLEYLTVTTGSATVAGTLRIDVGVTTTKNISITVLESLSTSQADDFTLGSNGRLTTDGDGAGDAEGNVTLMIGDDIVFENGATIFAEGALVVQADDESSDNDDGGALITMTQTPPITIDYVGVLRGDGGVVIRGGNDDDVINLQANRLATGNNVSVTGYRADVNDSGNDRFLLAFSPDFLLTVNLLTIHGGNADDADHLTIDHSRDLGRRRVEAAYATDFDPADPGAPIDGENSDFFGLGTVAGFQVRNMEKYRLQAGSSGHDHILIPPRISLFPTRSTQAMRFSIWNRSSSSATKRRPSGN